MIKSFRIDHLNLDAGLYVQGTTHGVVTYDLRMIKPYSERGHMDPKTAHTIEHLLATTLREVSDEIVYVGPMGCMTGFYILTTDKLNGQRFLEILTEAIERALKLDDIPGQAKESCGNYTFMDSDGARELLGEYLELIRKQGYGEYKELK